MRVAKWALNLVLPFIAIGFSRELIITISHAFIESTRWSSCLVGGVMFVPLWFVARRYFGTQMDYMATLEHELTHIVVALLFFKRPLSCE
jgi:hypothetical protein